MNTHELNTPTVNFVQAPAREGFAWVSQSFKLLKQEPVILHLAVLMFFSCFLILQLVPKLGSLAAVLLMPVLNLGLMRIIASIDHAETYGLGRLQLLWSGFGLKGRLKSMLMLGVIQATAMLAVAALVTMFDSNNAISTALNAKNPADITEQIQYDLRTLVIIGLMLYTPITAAFWFAPQLVGWHGQTVSKSIFFSLAAVWRNKTAFIVYGATLLSLFFIAVFLMRLLALLSGAGQLASTLLMAIGVFLSVVMYLSFYVSYARLVVVNAERQPAEQP